MDGRKLLLGDWTPPVRDGIDVLRLALVIAAVAALVAGNVNGALAFGFAAAFALLARVVNLPRLYDFGFVVVLTLHAAGEAFGWYDSLAWFDRVVHVVLPCLVAPVLYIGLARLDVLPDPRDDDARDLKAYYDHNGSYIWTLFLLSVLVLTVAGLDGDLDGRTLAGYVMDRAVDLIVLPALMLSLVLVRRRWWHWIVVGFLALLALGWLGRSIG